MALLSLDSASSELEDLRVTSAIDANCSGLPYYARCHGFKDDYALSIVDPTAYLYLDHLGFNPFGPGKAAASEIFSHGFESGDTSVWSRTSP